MLLMTAIVLATLYVLGLMSSTTFGAVAAYLLTFALIAAIVQLTAFVALTIQNRQWRGYAR